MAAIPVVAGQDPLGGFTVEFTSGRDTRIDEYRLRHAVFVREYRWLDDDGTGLERDEFDPHAVSFLIRGGRSAVPIASQRLLLPDRVQRGMVVPFERLFGDDPDGLLRERSTWAEVSRTTIAPEYRWGATTAPVPAMFAIKYASIALAAAAGRGSLFSVSDPRTARLVRRMGVRCRPLNRIVDYHGPRALYLMDMLEIGKTVPAEHWETLQRLTRDAEAAVRRVV